jgi:transcriptional regulator with XRE-family HTH domain
MPTTHHTNSLGRLIRRARLAKGLSLRAAAEQIGYAVSYLSRIEAGQYKSPRPRRLQGIARVLDIPIEDLYAVAHYDMPTRLPSLAPYLRVKYGELPEEALDRLEEYFEMLKERYGAEDGGDDA